MPRRLKIRIPAQTVIVDADAWATEYGVDPDKVRQDVQEYFAGICQQQIAELGLDFKDGVPS